MDLDLEYRTSAERPTDVMGKPMFLEWWRADGMHSWKNGKWKSEQPARIAERAERIAKRGGTQPTPEELAAELEYIDKYLEHDNNWDEFHTDEDQTAQYEAHELHCSACGGFSMYAEAITYRKVWGNGRECRECPQCKRINTLHDIGD